MKPPKTKLYAGKNGIIFFANITKEHKPIWSNFLEYNITENYSTKQPLIKLYMSNHKSRTQKEPYHLITYYKSSIQFKKWLSHIEFNTNITGKKNYWIQEKEEPNLIHYDQSII